jgi:hypothetical protein
MLPLTPRRIRYAVLTVPARFLVKLVRRINIKPTAAIDYLSIHRSSSW